MVEPSLGFHCRGSVHEASISVVSAETKLLRLNARQVVLREVQMRHRALAVILVVAVLLGVPILGTGQAPSGTKTFDETAINIDAAIKAAVETAKSAGATRNWTPPHTPWGDPDLQGYYFNHSGYTPLERPRELAGKPFYTEEEALAAFKAAVEADAEVDPRTVHYDWKEYGMDAWQSGVRPNLRTSLIVDPEDGKLPALTPEAQKRQADARAAARARNPQVGVQTLGNLYTRCITGNNAGPMTRGGAPGSDSAAGAAGVTAEAQLVQAPGYAVLIMQSNSDARIIPLDGRPHLPSTVRNWLGDSRGHWEGNTLVVETTNFIAPGTNFLGATQGLKLTERFTRAGPNTLRYEFSFDDPATWARPWSAETLLPRVEPPLYEFACHEQNYGLMNVVKGAQIREVEEAAKKALTK